MKHIVRKAYWNYEKEEKRLNEMSAKGMALTDYSLRRMDNRILGQLVPV